MTVHCWGERAAGEWTLEIHDTPSQVRNPAVQGKDPQCPPVPLAPKTLSRLLCLAVNFTVILWSPAKLYCPDF